MELMNATVLLKSHEYLLMNSTCKVMPPYKRKSSNVTFFLEKCYLIPFNNNIRMSLANSFSFVFINVLERNSYHLLFSASPPTSLFIHTLQMQIWNKAISPYSELDQASLRSLHSIFLTLMSAYSIIQCDIIHRRCVINNGFFIIWYP